MNISTEACETLGEDISAWMDDELPAEEAARVEAHVSSCAACQRRVDELRRMKAVLRSVRAPAAPVRLTEPALALVRRRAERRRFWSISERASSIFSGEFSGWAGAGAGFAVGALLVFLAIPDIVGSHGEFRGAASIGRLPAQMPSPADAGVAPTAAIPAPRAEPTPDLPLKPPVAKDTAAPQPSPADDAVETRRQAALVARRLVTEAGKAAADSRFKQAAAAYSDASDLGNMTAISELANLYAAGEGVKDDTAEAQRLRRTAYDGNHAAANLCSTSWNLAKAEKGSGTGGKSTPSASVKPLEVPSRDVVLCSKASEGKPDEKFTIVHLYADRYVFIAAGELDTAFADGIPILIQ